MMSAGTSRQFAALLNLDAMRRTDDVMGVM